MVLQYTPPVQQVKKNRPVFYGSYAKCPVCILAEGKINQPKDHYSLGTDAVPPSVEGQMETHFQLAEGNFSLDPGISQSFWLDS